MNLYAATMKGIAAAKDARRDRLLRQMAAADFRKAERLARDVRRAAAARTPVIPDGEAT